AHKYFSSHYGGAKPRLTSGGEAVRGRAHIRPRSPSADAPTSAREAVPITPEKRSCISDQLQSLSRQSARRAPRAQRKTSRFQRLHPLSQTRWVEFGPATES